MINNLTKGFTSGWIYKLQNKVNGKVYIGQTINKETRPYEHFKKKTNNRFKNAINKYGKENFELSYLCECFSREDIDWAEVFYILEWYDSTHYARGYNLRTEMQGDSNHFKNYTEEERKAFQDKLKTAFNKPETKLKKSISAKKASATPEHLEKMKALHTPEYRAKLSASKIKSHNREEVRQKMSDGHKKRFSDPVKKAKHKERILELKKTDKYKENYKSNFSKFLADPDKVKAWKEKLKLARNTPESIERNRQRNLEYYSNPENLEKHRARHKTENLKLKCKMAQRSPTRKYIIDEKHYEDFKKIKPSQFTVSDFINYFTKIKSEIKRDAILKSFPEMVELEILKLVGKQGRFTVYTWV